MPNDLKERESAPSDVASLEKEFGNDFSENEKSRLNDLSSSLGQGLYKGASNGRFSGLTTRKKAIGGGIAGGIVGIGSFFAIIASGPAQIIHYAEVMTKSFFSQNDDTNDSRTSKYLLYKAIGTPEMGRLGVAGNVIANRAEKRLNDNSGLKSTYDSNGRLTGYEITDQSKAEATLKKLRDAGFEPSADGKRIDLPRGSGANYKASRVVTKIITQNAGYKTGLASKINSRLLIKRGGVNFHPLKKVLRNQADNRALSQEEKEKARLEAEEQLRIEQAKALGIDTASFQGSSVGKKKNGLLQKFLKAGGAAAGAVTAVCTVREFSGQIDEQDLENERQKIKRGMAIITVASQIKTGSDLDQANLKIFSEPFYDEESKTTISQSAEYQLETGKTVTGPALDPSLQPGANSSNKPQIFKVVDSILGLGAVCGALNAATGFISAIPGVSQVTNLAGDALNAGLQAAGLSSIEEYYDRLLGYFAKGIGDAAGAKFGSVTLAGAKSAAAQQSIATAGVKQSDEASQQYRTMLQQERIASLSTYEKYFDVYNSDSVASNVAVSMPRSFAQLGSWLQQFPSSMTSTFNNTLGGFFGSKAYANPTASELYKFNDYGFLQEELSNPAYDSPYANAQNAINLLNQPCQDSKGNRIKPCGQDWINNAKKCFAVDINKEGAAWQVYSNNASDMLQYRDIDKLDSNDLSDILSSCADRSGQWLTIRFYILDTSVANALACYEGEQDSCNQIGFSGGNTAPATSTAPTTDDVRLLAQEIIANPNITYPLDAISSNGSTREAIEALARGELAPVACKNGTNPGPATTDVSPGMMGFLAELGSQTKIGINALTDKCHSRGSNHYEGFAVDFECNAVSFDVELADKIASKFGGRRNPETCEGDRHWHYDF